MTYEQAAILAILAGTMALFVWRRWRYDIVAFVALLASVVAGLVPFERAFDGFGHPATVTVAMVLVLSRALLNAGSVDLVAGRIRLAAKRPSLSLAGFSGISAALSGVINNVGALALLMPVAMQAAHKAKQSPAAVLMPLSFATILGGLTTMIGTPPNIIIATFREESAGAPFGMFDFTPVGGAVAVAGVLFVAFAGWRLIPKARRAQRKSEALFDLEDYVAEIVVPKGAPAVGKDLDEVEALAKDSDAVVVGRLRTRPKGFSMARREPVRAGEHLIIEASPKDLDGLISALGAEAVGSEGEKSGLLRSDDTVLMEAVVPPGARIERRSADAVRLRSRYGVNLLGVSRQGRPIRERLTTLGLKAGDVLLLQGPAERLPDVIAAIGCLPLAERRLQLGGRRQAWLCAGLFAAAIAAATAGLLPFPIALGIAAVATVVLNIVPPRQLYETIDWPVILLLGAMIPVGEALETTGGTRLIARTILDVGAWLAPAVVMTLLMIVTMTLSDVMNNAATAVVMAPISLDMAAELGVAADPFLMAVAVGASCAFLTPIGHQNNMLIMGPGGYRFGDYWRMGLPLEALIVCVAVPMILVVWPLYP